MLNSSLQLQSLFLVQRGRPAGNLFASSAILLLTGQPFTSWCKPKAPMATPLHIKLLRPRTTGQRPETTDKRSRPLVPSRAAKRFQIRPKAAPKDTKGASKLHQETPWSATCAPGAPKVGIWRSRRLLLGVQGKPKGHPKGCKAGLTGVPKESFPKQPRKGTEDDLAWSLLNCPNPVRGLKNRGFVVFRKRVSTEPHRGPIFDANWGPRQPNGVSDRGCEEAPEKEASRDPLDHPWGTLLPEAPGLHSPVI